MEESIDRSKQIHVAKFVHGLNVNSPITLTLGISMGNKKEEGYDLLSFIDMVNNNKSKIAQVDIMLSSHITRYYVGESEAQNLHDKWIENNKHFLNVLKVPYAITSWKDIIETEEYKEARAKLDQIYEKDESFRTKINNIAKSHAQKADFDTAKLYLLEEAAYFVYKKCHLTYPADHLNIACEHIIEKYNQEAIFHPYALIQKSIYHSKKKSKITDKLDSNQVKDKDYKFTPESIFFACVKAAHLMNKFGIHSSEEKQYYFATAIKQMEMFSKISNEKMNRDEKNKLSAHC